MTTNTENTKEPNKFENIRQLNALNQPGSEVNSLIINIKDMRKRIDAILSEQREKDREKERRRREEQRAAEEAANAKAVKEEKPKDPAMEEKQEVSPVVPEKVAVETVQEKPAATEPTAKSEKEKEPAAADNSAAIRTKQFDATPSYIRGRITPQTPTATQSSQKYQRPAGNSSFNRQQGGRDGFTPRGSAQGGAPFRPAQGGAGQRPNGSGSAFGGAKRPIRAEMPTVMPSKDRKSFDNKKKDFTKGADDKKSMNKRTLIRKGFIQDGFDEERVGVRKLKNKKVKEQPVFVPQKIEKAVITTENLTVKILSEKIGKTAQEIIKQLMLLGIMTNINSVVDFPTMELVANELGVELELKLEQSKESILEEYHDEADDEANLVKRPPIITVMGHVDHGKTSLLDAIRKTNVVVGEAGGITQHIGAYSVVCKGEKITFLDTPGHEAFTEMRARGAQVTDIAILVVAADDGIMPQTVEAINHAKAADVPIIVAINKIDKPAANIDKIKQTMTEYGLVTEEWGGDTMMIPISAKTGEGIDKLLESVLLLAEVNNYRANPNRQAKGSVVEAKLDKGKGPIANIIVLNGTLRVGDTVISGTTSGRVRAMADDKGRNIKEAGPSTPVSVLGFTEVPNAGDTVFAVSDEKMAKQVVAERMAKIKNEQIATTQTATLDDVFNKINEGHIKDLNIIIKADVQGSVEALKNSLAKLVNEEARVNIVHGGVGAINKSDIMLADVSKAIIIGFNVRPDSETKSLAENSGIEIRLYKVIYEAIDDIELAMKGLLAPKLKETVTGRAQVRNVFKITGSGIVAGSYITHGKIYRNSKVRVFRDGEVICESQIQGLKRFKDDVKEVAEGYECGISIENFSDIKELDEIEAYTIEEIKS